MAHFFSPPSGQNKSVVPRSLTPSEKAGGLLPGAKADAAARSGGGISPEFLQNIVGNQLGENPANLDILSEIRKSLGEQSP